MSDSKFKLEPTVCTIKHTMTKEERVIGFVEVRLTACCPPLITSVSGLTISEVDAILQDMRAIEEHFWPQKFESEEGQEPLF